MASHEHELPPEQAFDSRTTADERLPVAVAGSDPDQLSEQGVGETDATELDDDQADEVAAAKQAWDADDDGYNDETLIQPTSAQPALVAEGRDPSGSSVSPAEEMASAFVGRWNCLVSNTNWEKGRIISQWRRTLIEAGAAVTDYSDEAWAKQVGGVTASHVGRLRRVYDVFGDSHESYRGLFWTHFLVALDWDDAPLWLEGASQSRWSVSQMRQQHCEANGGDAAQLASQAIAANELDEDFDSEEWVEGTGTTDANPTSTERMNTGTQPAQGGGSTKKYDDNAGGVSSGPAAEGPDFGDEESLNRLSDDFHQNAAPVQPTGSAVPAGDALVQPFAGLPELPDDLVDAVEMLKLSVLRHKTSGWKEVPAEVVLQYLQAFRVLVEARSQ